MGDNTLRTYGDKTRKLSIGGKSPKKVIIPNWFKQNAVEQCSKRKVGRNGKVRK